MLQVTRSIVFLLLAGATGAGALVPEALGQRGVFGILTAVFTSGAGDYSSDASAGIGAGLYVSQGRFFDWRAVDGTTGALLTDSTDIVVRF